MYGCYVEVVFHFVAKAILFLCFFGFDIYPYILFHFFKCFLLFLYNYILTGAHEKTVGKERATPTQLIKTAKARHLVGVTIFICSTWPRPPNV